MEMTKGSASRRRRGIAAVATLAALACVAVLGLVAAQAAPPATGNALRKALPGPGENKLKDTTEFTGVEASKRFAIAVVRAKGGAVLAYVCDGKTIGRWLTGRVSEGRAALTRRGGSTLTIVFGARNRSATGRIAGKSVTFRLQKAPKGTGLRRYLTRHPDSNVRIEAGWVITKQGPLYGVATSPDGKVVLNSNTDTADSTGAGEAGIPPSGDPQPTGSSTGPAAR